MAPPSAPAARLVLACALAAGLVERGAAASHSLAFNSSAWTLDAENSVLYQLGCVYCTSPETADLENLAIFVPAQYMTATLNSDGVTYTASIDSSAARRIGGFTSLTAPIVIPVNTPGYAAFQPPTSYTYSSISSYLKAGIIYVQAGMRGRTNGYDSNGDLSYSGGAPWGVADLKAAVRYLRYNAALLPGNLSSIISAGMSGGGAQSCLAGTTGDSSLYTPYLESIGAAMEDASGHSLSDAFFASMCWCPITSLDTADLAYEWNMGQFTFSGTRASSSYRSALSQDMAKAFATFINSANLKDADGQVLSLTTSSSGIYLAGSYYQHLVKVVEGSLSNYLVDTEFNSSETSSGNGGMMDMMGGGPDGANNGEERRLRRRLGTNTHETPALYVQSLNTEAGEDWVTYDEATGAVSITGLEAFAKHVKVATKNCPAFDDMDRGQAENYVFGNDEQDVRHFDTTVSGLLSSNSDSYSSFSDWNSGKAQEFATDIAALDKFSKGRDYRMNMYNPMYYILPSYGGYGRSQVAPHFRIRTGITQGDTALTVEVNLALALEHNPMVKSVDFETVWGEGHVTAERTGDATSNLIEWIKELLPSSSTTTNADDASTATNTSSSDGNMTVISAAIGRQHLFAASPIMRLLLVFVTTMMMMMAAVVPL
mmetsp:Transcript_45902/g.99087  ORF Transcript_45902/g.99087 Transcript_45902/m.99087 type:complete len:656 (-) Transcript_45902:64-2031(-)